ncbi:carbohydrate ABC transporter permease [Eubacteriales bacterium mix99]
MIQLDRGDLHTKSRQKRFHILLSYIVLTILALIFLFPILWVIFSSFYDSKQATFFPPHFFPDPWTLRSYKGLSDHSIRIINYFKNTILIAALCIVGTLLSSSLAAFGFAKMKSRFKNALFFIVLSTMMIPSTVTLIPLYSIYSKIRIVDTFYPLILPAFLGGGAFSIFLLRQFFAAIPNELSESAIIDGCSWFQIYWKIVMPNAKPALIVVLINTFVYNWNDYFTPMIFLTSPENFTIAIGLTFSKDMYGNIIDTGPMAALACLSIVPIMILYLFCQKYFIEGVVTTGIKG